MQRKPLKAIRFLTRNFQAGSEWHDILKVLRGKDFQTKIPRKVTINNRKRNRDKQKLKKFITTNQPFKKW